MPCQRCCLAYQPFSRAGYASTSGLGVRYLGVKGLGFGVAGRLGTWESLVYKRIALELGVSVGGILKSAYALRFSPQWYLNKLQLNRGAFLASSKIFKSCRLPASRCSMPRSTLGTKGLKFNLDV